MNYFTWEETSLTKDCTSLESIASRYEEAARLMRKLSNNNFKLETKEGKKVIAHKDPKVFEDWGFINEESAYRQLKLISNKIF